MLEIIKSERSWSYLFEEDNFFVYPYYNAYTVDYFTSPLFETWHAIFEQTIHNVEKSSSGFECYELAHFKCRAFDIEGQYNSCCPAKRWFLGFKCEEKYYRPGVRIHFTHGVKVKIECFERSQLSQYLPPNYLTKVTETEIGKEDQVKDSIKEEEHSSNIAENEGEKARQVENSTIVIVNEGENKKMDTDSTSTNEI